LAEQAGEVAGQIIGEVANNAQNIFSLLEDVLAHVGEAFAEVIPDQAWNFVCTAIWFPIHETQCADARCAACTPAIMSAATVCQRTIGDRADARCLQEVHKQVCIQFLMVCILGNGRRILRLLHWPLCQLNQAYLTKSRQGITVHLTPLYAE